LPVWHSVPNHGWRSRMLILTRKQNESIVINDDIKVTILGTKGKDVKIGIEAPEDIEIWREEIYRQLEHSRNNKETSVGIDSN
jgi:carbon storage regulator